jgi:hypothetical protein
MLVKNRIQKLEQSFLRSKQSPAIVVEIIDGEISIDEEKSDPEALRQLYHDVELVYGNKAEERRS